MSYCTQQDAIDRYGEDELIQLTDRFGAGAIDAAVLVRAIVRAASQIDGYCRARYLIPLSPVDESILGINCDMARYYLYDDQASEEATRRYDLAIAELKDISAGRITLSAAQVTGGGAAAAPQFDAPERLFTRDTLKGF